MFLFLSVSCGKGRTGAVGGYSSWDSVPVLETRDVRSLVSDSGVVRYRINTPLWQVYDRLKPSRWSFVEGILLESFNEGGDSIEASIKADTAYYYDGSSLWELDGNVEIRNLQGEEFTTSQLFWSQQAHKVYSDRFIRIVQPDRIITGHGFESNQSMTSYRIFKPEGVFYVEDTSQQPQQAQDSTSLPEPSIP